MAGVIRKWTIGVEVSGHGTSMPLSEGSPRPTHIVLPSWLRPVGHGLEVLCVPAIGELSFP
jgi:hypothetical protein